MAPARKKKTKECVGPGDRPFSEPCTGDGSVEPRLIEEDRTEANRCARCRVARRRNRRQDDAAMAKARAAPRVGNRAWRQALAEARRRSLAAGDED